MPNFESIAEDYSLKIRSSIASSGISKNSSYLTESTNFRSAEFNVTKALKEINEDIKRYTRDGKPLTENDKMQIFNILGVKLGLKHPGTIYHMIRESSNDNFVALANYWSSFFTELVL